MGMSGRKGRARGHPWRGSMYQSHPWDCHPTAGGHCRHKVGHRLLLSIVPWDVELDHSEFIPVQRSWSVEPLSKKIWPTSQQAQMDCDIRRTNHLPVGGIVVSISAGGITVITQGDLTTCSDFSDIRLMSRATYVRPGSPVCPLGAFCQMYTKYCRSDVRPMSEWLPAQYRQLSWSQSECKIMPKKQRIITIM